MDDIRQLAATNLSTLALNPYPGRGIIVGLDDTGKNLIQVYWIMGRSENSRNRVFGCNPETGRVFTEAADPAKVKDSSLIIYNAMREVHHAGVSYYIASNGNQTDVVADGYAEDRGMHSSLSGVVYEPDAPNYTSRITASCRFENGEAIIKMSLLRKSPFSDKCCRHLFEIEGVGKGFGHCLTTYRGDSDGPLSPFRGEPYLLPLEGSPAAIAHLFWEVLDTENKVSLAAKSIPRDGSPSKTVIINKYSKV